MDGDGRRQRRLEDLLSEIHRAVPRRAGAYRNDFWLQPGDCLSQGRLLESLAEGQGWRVCKVSGPGQAWEGPRAAPFRRCPSRTGLPKKRTGTQPQVLQGSSRAGTEGV